MLKIMKITATLLTLATILLVVYAIYTSTYANILFWAIYGGIVILDLIIIDKIKKYDAEKLAE